ncbi:3860_t:CDS:1, partial [Dentiscutata heterogama]
MIALSWIRNLEIAKKSWTDCEEIVIKFPHEERKDSENNRKDPIRSPDNTIP